MTFQTSRLQAATTAFAGGAVVDRAAGGFAILHGSLAPAGCVIRLDASREAAFDGTARVFGHVESAQDAIFAGEIGDHDVIIMRDASVEALVAISRALDAMDLNGVTILTDSRARPTDNHIIGNVAPSSAAGGPIGRVRDGDTIHIDIEKRRIDLMKAENDTPAAIPANRKAFAPAERYARLFAAE